MSVGALGGYSGGGAGDKGLKLSLQETLRQAWADEDLRKRIQFVLFIFAVYALGVHVPVPVRGIAPEDIDRMLEGNALLGVLNMMGGGAFRRLSILALGLAPYINASIIMQVLTYGIPAWKKELQEGGEYARKQQNRRTRGLTLVLCVFQGFGLIQLLDPIFGQLAMVDRLQVVVFWTAGAMFMLWLGEQISERGIGNGVSLLIFAGIVISLPWLIGIINMALMNGVVTWWQVVLIVAMFLATTWFVVLFTVAQRRIPIQHMRRQFGTKSMGGQTSYLPISVNMAGVIPIIFGSALIYLPMTAAAAFPPDTTAHNTFAVIARFMMPNFAAWEGWVGALLYMGLIFFFTYFWNAMIYNVEDIANNLKKHGSYIPGIRPGKQTKEFLDGVISRVTFVGALFLSVAALTQYLFPLIAPIAQLPMIAGTSVLIMVAVALETMRQIEANLLIKQYER